MKQRTFVMIKPDHFLLAYDIFRELDQHGNRINVAHVNKVPQKLIEDHYIPHKGKSFYKYMTRSFVNRSIWIAIYEGNNIIQKLIDIIGPTDPSKAPQNTIRGRFSEDTLQTAIDEQRPVKNVIHRSDSVEEAKREIQVWQEYLGNIR